MKSTEETGMRLEEAHLIVSHFEATLPGFAYLPQTDGTRLMKRNYELAKAFIEGHASRDAEVAQLTRKVEALERRLAAYRQVAIDREYAKDGDWDRPAAVVDTEASRLLIERAEKDGIPLE